MWANIRSAVADGVKEFRTGALSEVQHGFAETTAVVKEAASDGQWIAGQNCQEESVKRFVFHNLL